MSKKIVLIALAVALFLVLSLGLAYQLVWKEKGKTRETVRVDSNEPVAPLNGLEARLRRIEETLASIREIAPESIEDKSTEDKAPAVPSKSPGSWDEIKAELAALHERVKGLEADPVRRAYWLLGSENPEMRREGINVLARVARHDPAACDAIRDMLDDASKRVREQAAQKLRDLKDVEAKSALITLLQDPYDRARYRAVQALGAINAKEAAQEIGRVLASDASAQVRRTALEVLKKWKVPGTEDFVIKALKDPASSIRGYAVVALGDMGAVSAIPELRVMLDQGAEANRLNVVSALNKLGDKEPLQGLILQLKEQAVSHSSEKVRREAIRSLSGLSRATCQALFRKALEDPSPVVRKEAERALIK